MFTTPPAWRVREAFGKIPYIVSFSSFLDETTALADLILPDHSFLESWSGGGARVGRDDRRRQRGAANDAAAAPDARDA